MSSLFRRLAGLLVFWLAVTVTVPGVSAQPELPRRLALVIDALSYNAFSLTDVQATPRGVWVLTGLSGIGWAQCEQQACRRTGVEGQPIDVEQDLQIVIDVIGAGILGVEGLTRGHVTTMLGSREVTMRFTGTVSGSAVCADPGESCAVDLVIDGQIGRRGSLSLTLGGTLSLLDGSWQNVGGGGQLVSFDGAMEQ